MESGRDGLFATPQPGEPFGRPPLVVLPDPAPRFGSVDDDLREGAFGFYEQAVELVARVNSAQRPTCAAVFLKLFDDVLTCVAAHDEAGIALRGPYRVAEHPDFGRAVESGNAFVGQAVAVAPVRAHGVVVGLLAVATHGLEFGSEQSLQLVTIANLIGFRVALDATFREFQKEAELSRRLERLKSEFLNIAAHELRSPLGIVRGYVSMLREGTLADGDRDAALARIGEKSEEMAHLISEMLETARLETLSLSLSLEPVDLHAILEDALNTVRPLLGIAHSLAVDRGRGAISVVADRARLTTVLTNLIDNAIKYSPNGGEIEIRLDRDSRVAIIVVRDHGIGIGAEQIPMLFTRFGRLVTPETSHIRGTGLGLYLARETARLHGGDIVVASEPGAGSTFTVTLPLASVTG
ncbi:MAG TPA: HAMP domain-containing sensor histidine kinase [Candidatus Saccharimonadales bacterium]|nr:HAMP domain-containing sensor histidine kinase [Candidatus Saccharimonadales bacterium]